MAARPDSPVVTRPNEITDGMELTVLDLGVEFSYTIPTLSVLSVSLRQCKIQFETRHGSARDEYDGFIRSDPFLHSAVPPFVIKLTKHCFVPVSLTLEHFSSNRQIVSSCSIINTIVVR